jgi:peptidoglycan hydrolase-like protein with peptidoglycan-binding domain
MKTWTTALALIAAGTMLAGPAFAQATSPSGDQKDKAQTGSSMGTDASKSDSTTNKDTMKSSDPMKSEGGKAAKAGKGGHHMARGGNAEQVRAVQQALKDKGHDPGDIDGKMGPKTQAALKDFQSKEGLKATGRMDSETRAKLGVEAKSGAADSGAVSNPSASPKTDTKAEGSKSDSSAGASSSGASSPSTGSSSTPGASDTSKTDSSKK